MNKKHGAMRRRDFMRLLGAGAAATALAPGWAGAAGMVDGVPLPFVLARELKSLAGGSALDAGTGNPNYMHQSAREALVALTQLAQQSAAGELLVKSEELTDDFRRRLAERPDRGARLLIQALEVAAEWHPWKELTDQLCQMALGNTYSGIFPVAESAIRAYVTQRVLRCRLDFELEVTPTLGASDGLGGLFKMLMEEKILSAGDRLALLTPTFSPLLLVPELAQKVELVEVELKPQPSGVWTLPAEEAEKLADPRVKVFFVVDPGNPVPSTLPAEEVDRLARLVAARNPDLLLVTDLVYAPLTRGFTPILQRLPEQTLGVCSWSKHFGATGWRLGAVVAHPGQSIKRRLRKYVGQPCEPQQAALTLFSLAQLTTFGEEYQAQLLAELETRWRAFYEGLGRRSPEGDFCHFFALVEFQERGTLTDELDSFRRLASEHSVVAIPGRCFGGPVWSARVSLASLSVDQCRFAGRALRQVFGGRSGSERSRSSMR